MLVADEFPDWIESWADVATLIEHFSYFSAHAWLFRGVTNANHALVPKVGREHTRANKTDPTTGRRTRVPYRLPDERAVFEMFKRQARSHLTTPPATPLEWLAIAQHFGLPTRLLDWTESLLVAVWFAVEKAGAKPSPTDAAVWVTRQVNSINADAKEDPLSIATPCVYRPAHVSERIAAQASVLMVCPEPTQALTLPFTRKITISRTAEFLIKKRLNACGINKRQLFPDLSGLADHLAWLHKQDYLAGYRDGDAGTIGPTPDDSQEE